MKKLLERVRIIKELFSRRVEFKVLTVANIEKALDFLKKLVEEGVYG